MKYTNKIDITMTAVLRPHVIEQTLESFTKNLFYNKDIEYRLIINVDNIGEAVYPKQIRKICEKYFSNIVFNFSKNPSFTRAVMWCWNQIDSDLVFHLEDDWVIKRKTDLDKMINIINPNNDLSCLHLMRHDMKHNKSNQLFGTEYEYNKALGIFISKKPFGFSLNPVLVKAKFIEKVRSVMTDNKNPEKQIRMRNKKMNSIISKWKYGIYASPGESALINGKNGLRWRKKNRLIKPPNSQFICWEKEG